MKLDFSYNFIAKAAIKYYVGIEYSTRDLICDVINYCARSGDMHNILSLLNRENKYKMGIEKNSTWISI